MIETKDQIKKRNQYKKQFSEKSRDSIKIINSTYFRDFCHLNGVKISEEALLEFANINKKLLLNCIEDTKELGRKIILRRFVERRN